MFSSCRRPTEFFTTETVMFNELRIKKMLTYPPRYVNEKHPNKEKWNVFGAYELRRENYFPPLGGQRFFDFSFHGVNPR